MDELDNTFELNEWLLDQWRIGKLTIDTLVVTRVLRAQSCVVLISDSKNAKVELQLSAGGERQENGTFGLRAAAETTIARATGMYANYVINEISTPLFGGIRLRKSFIAGAEAKDILLGPGDRAHKLQDALDGREPGGPSTSAAAPFEEIGLPSTFGP